MQGGRGDRGRRSGALILAREAGSCVAKGVVGVGHLLLLLSTRKSTKTPWRGKELQIGPSPLQTEEKPKVKGLFAKLKFGKKYVLETL